jgi:type VI secretion system secreted protein Hcp
MNRAKQRSISLTVLLALSAFGIGINPPAAAAQTSIFMKVDGITGSSTDPRHTGWINIASLGQSASNPVLTTAGAGKVVGACDVEVLKGLDAAGPHLWAALFAGRPIASVFVEVWMTRPIGDQVKVYELRLQNVRLTNITAASAMTFAETVRMSGERIQLSAIPYSPTGAQLPTVQSGWDCIRNTPY